VLGVYVTITVMVTISLGSVISDSISGDGLEWKLIGVEWVLWCGKWGCLSKGSSSYPFTIVLGVNVTISIMISISLGSIISDSVSRNSLEWELIGVKWVLWGSKWSSLS